MRRLSSALVMGVALAIGASVTLARPASPQAASPRVAAPQAASPQAAVPPQAGAFHSEVDLVSLTVTVSDATGHYVTDLSKDDFSVLEDGVKQDLTFFSRTSLPLSLSLLVDTSASMDDKIATVRAAASRFVAHLRPEDQAQLINFDSRVAVLLPFTSAHANLDRAIASLSAGGSTALYNAVYIALKELKKSQATSADRLRRQAIVLLTDGQDSSSLVSFDEVVEQVKRSETSVYAIGLTARDSDIGKGYSEAAFVLRQIAGQSGGSVFFPRTVEDLPAIYTQIWQELSSQYLLGYASTNPRRDGKWRRVVAHADRAGTTARTRQGYYGPSL